MSESELNRIFRIGSEFTELNRIYRIDRIFRIGESAVGMELVAFNQK
jgi:hypothetical protein